MAAAWDLGGAALVDPDEGETAAAALAMAASGEVAVPRLNGLPRLDKPILWHAPAALLLRGLGRSELAVRLPSLLAGWAMAAAVAWFAGRRFGPASAWIAALAAVTAPLVLAMERTARGDALLALFVTLALIAFFQAIERDPSRRGVGRYAWSVFAWAAMGAGVLTKGPVALALPLLVAGPYARWRRRSAAVWQPLGVLALLAVVLPWLLAVEARVPGFLAYALGTETWERLTAPTLERSGPIWYFLPFLIGGGFPWIVVGAAASLRERRPAATESHRDLVFLALWIALPLLFFSLSQSKRPPYVLPLVPAIALLAARSWSGSEPPRRAVRAAAVGWALLAGAFLLAAGLAPRRLEEPLAATAAPAATALALAALTAAIVAWLAAARRELAPVALSLPLLVAPVVLAPAQRAGAEAHSSRHFAEVLQPRLEPGTRLVGLETFTPSMAFYLDRPVLVSTSTAETFGSNFIRRKFETLLAAGAPTLCRAPCWQQYLEACDRPTIFLLKPRYAEVATLAAAGLPTLYRDDSLLAMGPCRRADGALPPPP